MNRCFACNQPIKSAAVPCPHCGYKFTADDDRYCPNMNFGLCRISEIPCTYGISWQTCPTKNKVEEESGF